MSAGRKACIAALFPVSPWLGLRAYSRINASSSLCRASDVKGGLPLVVDQHGLSWMSNGVRGVAGLIGQIISSVILCDG